ncbi:hypothetical protein [Hymenobacter lapidiphilus]|uniref:Uncharacterized protein n=1 Tax=Hymenobacter lapidiphilus TaxID=2608003 RepID=A0A7Y7U7I5_9BACT|nr:hypothetical protein [Hymenobacter lapidiphilus]NVO33462.1 hypothetical protein [Hymenobacter lapidiphilus]
MLIPFWLDLTVNPATGKASLKNVAGTVGFIVGIGLAVVAVAADVYEHRPVDKTAVMLLLASGLGLSGLKVLQMQLDRRTADEAGPLAVPPPAEEAPHLMPQAPAGFDPEAPETRPLAGYPLHRPNPYAE